MPLYIYECEDGHRTELMRLIADYQQPVTCECGKPAQQVIVSATPLDLFPAGVWEDISPTPIEITSRRQLIEVCRKNGCYARNYMEDYSPRERAIRSGV